MHTPNNLSFANSSLVWSIFNNNLHVNTWTLPRTFDLHTNLRALDKSSSRWESLLLIKSSICPTRNVNGVESLWRILPRSLLALKSFSIPILNLYHMEIFFSISIPMDLYGFYGDPQTLNLKIFFILFNQNYDVNVSLFFLF